MTQRVIKFRAWEPSTETMHYNLGYISNGGRAVMGEHRPIIGGILLQFSGLLDKHGKEIYEHDLYRRYSYVYRVEWDKESAGFAGIVVGRYDNNGENYSPCTSDRLFNISEDEETELVGNIYTTPELVDPKMIENGNS